MYKKIKLDNGLRVLSHRMPNMQSVALGIWIKVGGRYEFDKNQGISHFLEHLVFKGTKKYSCRKLKESIEGVGGSLNGFTSEELTCYLVKTPARHLATALDVLADMVINPLIPPVEVEKEKTVILEEIKMYRDQPQSYVYELLDELMWPKQQLGRPVIGTAESVRRINRKELADFKDKYYSASSILVNGVGLFKPDEFNKRVGHLFSRLGHKPMNTFEKAREAQVKPQLKVHNKDTEQTHMALGFHAFKRDHHLRHALAILHIVLGGNMSSRLFEEVREKKGLAYEIGTSLKRFSDTGAFIVHAGIDNGKLIEAVSLILKELRRAKDSVVSDDEFIRAKEFYRGQMMLALEDTMDYMLWLGETSAVLDKEYTFDELMKEVDRVKRKDLKEAAKTIITDNRMSLALISPLKGKEDEIYKLLKVN
ncbi:MAG: pitrilysin family protein [Candidatus Omnitrophota bacterium]|jgi:predicted Zn-dependent peptidase